MKVISGFQKFGILVLISFFIGFVIYLVTSNIKTYHDKIEINTIMVNGTVQKMPIKIDENYEIIDAKLDEYEITVSLLDKNSGEIYESTLPSEELEDFVCNVQYYSYKGSNKRYDCSSEDKIIESMITEVGLQSVEIIKEGY